MQIKQFLDTPVYQEVIKQYVKKLHENPSFVASPEVWAGDQSEDFYNGMLKAISIIAGLTANKEVDYIRQVCSQTSFEVVALIQQARKKRSKPENPTNKQFFQILHDMSMMDKPDMPVIDAMVAVSNNYVSSALNLSSEGGVVMGCAREHVMDLAFGRKKSPFLVFVDNDEFNKRTKEMEAGK